MKFWKMQAFLNDYIYIDAINQVIDDPSTLALRLCNRHLGVGSDGLVLALKSEVADLRMRIFNPDGSEAQMCGNALRSLAKIAYLKGLVKKKRMSIETLGGIKKANLIFKNKKLVNIEANIGFPILEAKKIRVLTPKDTFLDEEVQVLDKKFRVSALSWGNPHVVVFVDDLANFDVAKYGKCLEEMTSLFPDKTNVSFVEIVRDDYLKLREWERGTGETLGCATGCSSAVVVAHMLKGCKAKALVEQIGGIIKINYDLKKGLTMIGNSTLVYEGELKNI